MTKFDKMQLRKWCRDNDPRTDERLATLCDCKLSTVKKYRRIFGQPIPRFVRDETGLHRA